MGYVGGYFGCKGDHLGRVQVHFGCVGGHLGSVRDHFRSKGCHFRSVGTNWEVRGVTMGFHRNYKLELCRLAKSSAINI